MSVVYKDEETLIAEAMEYGASLEIDTREGSVFYDTAVGYCARTAQFYADLKIIADLILLDSAEGEILDELGSENGITRLAAVAATYALTYEGTEPDTGSQFFIDELYFTVSKVDGAVYLVAEEAGTGANGLTEGEPVVPVDNIDGLTAASLGAASVYGVDEEKDEDYRERIREKIGKSAENGNQQHYKTWCEGITGVGRAKIVPLWAGDCTIKAVIISKLGGSPLESLVSTVQETIDPTTRGYTVEVDGVTYPMGDGEGEGLGNVGAHFTAVGAIQTVINISVSASFKNGGTNSSARSEIIKAVTGYFMSIALDADEEDVVVRYTSIGSIISAQNSVLDYSNLLINGSTDNIIIGDDYVPVLGEVSVNGSTT